MTITITEKDNSGVITEKLSESWNNTGVNKGDTLLLHSSLSGFMRRYKLKNIHLTPDIILESFLKAIGEKGTLLLPTFNFEFTKGRTFDVRYSVSENGILTETARKRIDSVRTAHPLFSFAVLGHQREKFASLENYTAFGKDSPFELLYQLDGKIAALDIAGENCMTFYHYAEEKENAPNRYHKKFKGLYIDINGNESIREFDLYARKLDMRVETDVKPMEEYLWSKGYYTGNRPGEGNCLHVIKARKVYEEAAALIKEGRSLNMLYKIGNEF